MWPLPEQTEVNSAMSWQYRALLFARRGWRVLAIVLAALIPVALIVNPSWKLAYQAPVMLVCLLAFDLLLGLAARLTLSFVEKDAQL